MKRQTVKKRIFIANAWMILVTIALVGFINIGVIKLYWESIEQEWQMSMQTIAATADSREHQRHRCRCALRLYRRAVRAAFLYEDKNKDSPNVTRSDCLFL